MSTNPTTTTNFDKFLTPEAMVTPGVAGSMSMMFGNALHYNFNIPNGWAVLVLSFVFGLLVLANSEPMLKRAVLYVVNSLVIFCVAAGTVTLGANGGAKAQANTSLFIQPAYAQSTTVELQAEYKQLTAEYDVLWTKLSASPKGADVSQLLSDLREVERKRTAVVRSLPREPVKSGSSAGEKQFFAPLKF